MADTSLGAPPSKPSGSSTTQADLDKWQKDMAEWWQQWKKKQSERKPPSTGHTDESWIQKARAYMQQILNDTADDLTPKKTSLKPSKGGIWAAATTAIDYIAFLVECSVFECFILEEACQIMARLTLDYMCPLDKSMLFFKVKWEFHFVLAFATINYLGNSWTLAYSKSGYQAYFNACWILIDAGLMILGEPVEYIVLE